MKKLREYQKEALKFGRSRRHFGLFHSMRLGKTLTTIRIIKTYPEADRVKVLVVAPFSAWSGWCSDLAEECVKVVPLIGSSANRMKILDGPGTWFLTNYESHIGIGKKLASIPWDVVVLDESDSIKNPKAKVSKFYTSNFRGAKHRIILTGTPAPESDMNYYSQLMFLDSGAFPQKNWYYWRSDWCSLNGFKWVLKSKMRTALLSTVASYCHTLRRSDINLGSERITIKKFVQLNARAAKAYSTIEQEFILADTELDVLKMAQEQFQVYIWMRMLASGIMQGEMIWDGKINELIETIRQLEGASFVVWAVFREELKVIDKALCLCKIPHATLNGENSLDERAVAVENFRQGKIQGLLANPEILKYGADLSIADTMIWFSLPASGKTFDQASERTVRIGKDNAVTSIILLTEHTVDEIILENLQNKESRIDGNHYALKRLREKQNGLGN